MQTALKTKVVEVTENPAYDLGEAIATAWNYIAPFWPLKNLIACNPLQGLEDLPFEQALNKGIVLFQRADLPSPLLAVNRQTIKWCQVLFDDGQASLTMPLREQGFFAAWRQLAVFDAQLHQNNQFHKMWLNRLPLSAEQTIAECLVKLNIPAAQHETFLTLLLTTLPGWAAYAKYRLNWEPDQANATCPIRSADYLAVRLVITTLLWPDAAELLVEQDNISPATDILATITTKETAYRQDLLANLKRQAAAPPTIRPAAQMIFCIDVRSEPMRRAIEGQGDYETFGFAGFFGLPISLQNEKTGERYASCPVLLQPKYHLSETSCTSGDCASDNANSKARLRLYKSFYQALKYHFTTPFALVETLGLWAGLWMGLRTLAPQTAIQLKTNIVKKIRPEVQTQFDIAGSIPFADQCTMAGGALRMMGLTQNFAPLVVLCGHGSTTQNNAYATALDCGACGGRHGGSNARILAAILNHQMVRVALVQDGIVIPADTHFIAAQHDTTTDAINLLVDDELLGDHRNQVSTLHAALSQAQHTNQRVRAAQMNTELDHIQLRSCDWAQTRPEWGLARNAAFIVGPRSLTATLNLAGRSFLHSYDWQQDANSTALTTILTAPMVVAQWINSQYLFSSLDNVAYGSGSKITQNVTGKMGIMQGNASDLMHGLPLQSVYSNDNKPYHQLQRLLTVVYAPKAKIDKIIAAQPVLQKLFGNGWVQLVCLEPASKLAYQLQRDFTWEKLVGEHVMLCG